MTVITKTGTDNLQKKSPCTQGLFFYIKAFFFLLSTYMQCPLDRQGEILPFVKKITAHSATFRLSTPEMKP
jgi:hypothetical protein